jgi:hypothetical protein
MSNITVGDNVEWQWGMVSQRVGSLKNLPKTYRGRSKETTSNARQMQGAPLFN